MKKGKVSILTASDAHIPRNVGLYFRDMTDIIEKIDTGRQQRVEIHKGFIARRI